MAVLSWATRSQIEKELVGRKICVLLGCIIDSGMQVWPWSEGPSTAVPDNLDNRHERTSLQVIQLW
jgi:hypothetical protein